MSITQTYKGKAAMIALAGLVVAFSFSLIANAGVGVGVTPDFPASVSVGQTAIPVGLEITNNSTADVGSITLSNIRLIPSCGDTDSDSTTCAGAEVDPGVFTASATGTGSLACAASTFTIAVNDATTGQLLFTPNAPIALAPGDTCRINFTVDVVQMAVDDSSPNAGLQTLQMGRVSGANDGLSGTGLGTDETTVVPQGHIIVNKVTNPSGDTQSFSFDATGTGYNDFSLTDTATPNDQTLNAGTYSVSESLPAGWTQTSATCVSSTGGTETVGNISLQAGETVTCTFTNTKMGNIVVNKVTSPSGSTQSFNFDASGTGYNDFALTDAADPNNQQVVPGTYSVSEGAVAGWNSDGGVCDNGETPASIDVGAGETITCTFTNTLDQGRIELQKDFSGTPESVTLNIGTSQGGSQTDSAVLNTDGTTGENTVVAGTYYVSETQTTPANYSSILACFNDVNDDDTIDGGDTSHALTNATGAVVVASGEDVICRFTNTFNPGNIIVVKQTIPDGDQTDFDFTSDYDNDGFMLSDGEQNDSGELAPGAYNVSETAEVGWAQTSAVCDSTDEADVSTPGNITLGAGETVTCTFTNTKNPEPGRIIIVKQTNPDGDVTEFEFDTSYGDNFMLSDGEQNDSGEMDAGTYSVAEINMADNWALSSATCSDGSDVDSIELGAGETVTCTFTNTYTPPATQGCSPGYWKQSQHFGSYPTEDGVYPNTLFSEVFGSNTFGNKTLLQVLSQGGGGINALGRIMVAAYLNASTVENFAYTPEEVIEAFNDATPATYGSVKATFEALQDPCPFGKNPGPAEEPTETRSAATSTESAGSITESAASTTATETTTETESTPTPEEPVATTPDTGATTKAPKEKKNN